MAKMRPKQIRRVKCRQLLQREAGLCRQVRTKTGYKRVCTPRGPNDTITYSKADAARVKRYAIEHGLETADRHFRYGVKSRPSGASVAVGVAKACQALTSRKRRRRR